MTIFRTILFGLAFGIGLYLGCESIKVPENFRECTITRYKVNSTENVHGLYMCVTTSDNMLCYSRWIELAKAPTYREISHIFDRLMETRPLGSRIKCHHDIVPELNMIQLCVGLTMIVGSLFIVISPMQ